MYRSTDCLLLNKVGDVLDWWYLVRKSALLKHRCNNQQQSSRREKKDEVLYCFKRCSITGPLAYLPTEKERNTEKKMTQKDGKKDR